MSVQTQPSRVEFESQGYAETAWFKDAFEGGTAKDNYDRIVQLRRLFCHPLMMCNDGSLSKEYFTNTSKETAMDWTDIEILQLYEGMHQFGVSSITAWNAIQSQFLPQRDFIEVRLRLSQLLGTQDLAKYGDRKFENEQEIHAEFEKNKREALENGTWDEAANIVPETSVAALSGEQEKEQQSTEAQRWKKFVWENPNYIFRTHDDSDSDGKKKSKSSKNKKVKVAADPKQNTIEGMLQKKAKPDVQDTQQDNETKEEPNTDDDCLDKSMRDKVDDDERKASEKENISQSNNENKNKNKNKNIKSKSKRTKQKKQTKVPLMPNDSEDEDMLCVE